MPEDCEEQSPRTAVFYIDGEQFVLKGQQIDELWDRLTPDSTFEDKLREVPAVRDEVKP